MIVFAKEHGGLSKNTLAVNIELTSAVPEPETYAMMLAGLGLLGWVGRRRNQKTA
jgi:hypothetical protein